MQRQRPYKCTWVCNKNICICFRPDISYTAGSVQNDKAALRKFISELSGHHNFLWFNVMNLVQVSACVYVGMCVCCSCVACACIKVL